MTQKLVLNDILPDTYQGMILLGKSMGKDTINPILKQLIKIRASQINGCAFCLQIHCKEAIAQGESVERIYLLNGWKETDKFTKEEKTLLKAVEEITLIDRKGLTEGTYDELGEFFTKVQIAHIITHTVVINAWNRFALSTHMPTV